MRLSDEQHALLAERLADEMMKTLDAASLERMVYDMYLDEFLLMGDSELLFEAETMEVEVPSELVV
jgi:hypothetical protein